MLCRDCNSVLWQTSNSWRSLLCPLLLLILITDLPMRNLFIDRFLINPNLAYHARQVIGHPEGDPPTNKHLLVMIFVSMPSMTPTWGIVMRKGAKTRKTYPHFIWIPLRGVYERFLVAGQAMAWWLWPQVMEDQLLTCKSLGRKRSLGRVQYPSSSLLINSGGIDAHSVKMP